MLKHWHANPKKMILAKQSKRDAEQTDARVADVQQG